jgi:pimeloyl-ACP methyl ester carboxylesterase/sterol desaturase/sphingolipid hydroxylase (fatty acid hydroxylase superfamily)
MDPAERRNRVASSSKLAKSSSLMLGDMNVAAGRVRSAVPIVQPLARYGYPLLMLVGLNVLAIHLAQRGAPSLALVAVVLVAIVLSFAAERLLPYEEAWNRSRGDAIRDGVHFFVNGTSNLLGVAALPLLARWLAPFGHHWPSSWPFVVQVGFAVLVFDFGVTMTHWASHRLPFLWRFHSVHHSVDRFYGFNGFMKHPVHQAIEMAVGIAPLLALGLPSQVAAALAASTAIQLLLQHSNVAYDVGPLRYVLALSQGHRFHHLKGEGVGDVNLGLFTNLWDHVLGTWSFDPRCRFTSADLGIAKEPNFPRSYLAQLAAPFRTRTSDASPRSEAAEQFRRIHSDAADAADLDPALRVKHRELVVDRRRIAYFEAGHGEDVCILIHGLPGCRHNWALTIPALARTRRVLAIDMPGFGDSEMLAKHDIGMAVHVIDTLRKHVNADRVDLIGQSLGTLIACEVAARLPHTVRRLVLAGGPIVSAVALFHKPIATLWRNPRMVNLLRLVITSGIPAPAWLRERIVHSRWVRRHTLAPVVARPACLPASTVRLLVSGVGAKGALPTLRQGFGYDFAPALAGVACPTLAIGGKRDKIAPESDLRAFAAAKPSSRRVEILPDTGHTPMLEQPRQFNRLVTEFLSTPDPACVQVQVDRPRPPRLV